MGFLSKAWKGIKKGWDAIDDYAIPVLSGAALGALTMGAGAALMGGVATAGGGVAGAASGIASGVAGAAGVATGAASGISAATAGALMGGLAGFQMGNANVQAEKAAAASADAAKRQELLANSAATTVAATKSTQEAQYSDSASARGRRYSHGKTARSGGLGLSRYATSTSKRTTLG